MSEVPRGASGETYSADNQLPAKKRTRVVLDNLPEDATVEEIQETLKGQPPAQSTRPPPLGKSDRVSAGRVNGKGWYIALLAIVVCSVAFDLLVLSKYSISYGPDGPYYDIQIRHILASGLPQSNDPPLIYYLLTPFVVIFQDSHLGIKVGMAIISSCSAIPAFLIADIVSSKRTGASKIPALLSAFLVTINVFYLRMIEDFMQNLVGAFFMLWAIYFGAKWFEDFQSWKKYGILTGIFVICVVATHVYTGGVTLVVILSLFAFDFVAKWVKTRKMPKIELKILLLLFAAGIGILVGLVVVFPTIYTNFSDRIQSFLSTFSTSTGGISQQDYNIANLLCFLTVPFLLGIVVITIHCWRGIKRPAPQDGNPVLPRETLLAWVYLVLSALIFLLVAIPSQWQQRFILLVFVPISLVTPVGVAEIEHLLHLKKPRKKALRYGLSGSLTAVFCIFTLLSSMQFTVTMGPTLTQPQYNELQAMNRALVPAKINTTGVVLVDNFEFGYWVEWVFNMQWATGSHQGLNVSYPGVEIYQFIKIRQVDTPFKAAFEFPWNPFLPMPSMPIGGSPGQQQPGQQPPPGQQPKTAQQQMQFTPVGRPIYRGEYFEARLIYFANGTLAK